MIYLRLHKCEGRKIKQMQLCLYQRLVADPSINNAVDLVEEPVLVPCRFNGGS